MHTDEKSYRIKMHLYQIHAALNADQPDNVPEDRFWLSVGEIVGSCHARIAMIKDD